MTTWFARFSYEVEFQSADANEADETLERIRSAETVFGIPIVDRSNIFLARRDPRDKGASQEEAQT